MVTTRIFQSFINQTFFSFRSNAMKGDFSRNTYNPNKKYSSVRMQQGRVQVDADWNEQMDIIARQGQTVIEDLFGPSVGPSSGAGFKITNTDPTPSTDFNIGVGRYYVNGILIENLTPITYLHQPDYPGTVAPTFDSSNNQNNIYLAYLEAWPQSISATEDPTIAEPALNGADTATRITYIPQVKLLHTAWDGT